MLSEIMLSESVQSEGVGDEFKVGDTAYCALNGIGTVASVYLNARIYPVVVEFDRVVKGKHVNKSYTKNGSPWQGSERTLFFTPTSINKGLIKRPFVPKLEGRTFYFRFVDGESFCATVQYEIEGRLGLSLVVDNSKYNRYSFISMPKSRIQSMREVGEEIKP